MEDKWEDISHYWKLSTLCQRAHPLEISEICPKWMGQKYNSHVIQKQSPVPLDITLLPWACAPTFDPICMSPERVWLWDSPYSPVAEGMSYHHPHASPSFQSLSFPSAVKTLVPQVTGALWWCLQHSFLPIHRVWMPRLLSSHCPINLFPQCV